MCCRIFLYGIKHAARGGADVAESVVLLACPTGPIPLAARGLPAVLARAGPGGRTGRKEALAIGSISYARPYAMALAQALG
jgi:hypothetical protein